MDFDSSTDIRYTIRYIHKYMQCYEHRLKNTKSKNTLKNTHVFFKIKNIDHPTLHVLRIYPPIPFLFLHIFALQIVDFFLTTYAQKYGEMIFFYNIMYLVVIKTRSPRFAVTCQHFSHNNNHSIRCLQQMAQASKQENTSNVTICKGKI